MAELLIVLGAILLFVGIGRGTDRGSTAIGAGVGMCALGTLEFALREHVAGVKSHAFFIVLLSVGIAHIAASIVFGSVASNPLVAVVDVIVLVGATLLARRAYGWRPSTPRPAR